MTPERVDELICGWSMMMGKSFTEEELNSLVDLVAKESNAELEAVEADLKQYKQDALEANDQFEMQDRNERQLRKELLESQAREMKLIGALAPWQHKAAYPLRAFTDEEVEFRIGKAKAALEQPPPPIAALITRLVSAMNKARDCCFKHTHGDAEKILRQALDDTVVLRKGLGL